MSSFSSCHSLQFSSPRSSLKLPQSQLFRSRLQFGKYRVGRALLTRTDHELPKIYRSELWATNVVSAQDRLGNFGRKLKKIQKNNVQVLAMNEDDEDRSTEEFDEELKIIFYPDREDTMVEASERVSRLKRTTGYGVRNNFVIMTLSTLLLLIVDELLWKILHVPLPLLHLTTPFIISMVLCGSIGDIFSHGSQISKIQSMRKDSMLFPKPSFEGWLIVPKTNCKSPNVRPYSSYKMISPKDGGRYFIPIGILVSLLWEFPVYVRGPVVATCALAIVGVCDDIYHMPDWMITILKATVGVCFYCWMLKADIPTPYGMKWVIPCPAPIGLVVFDGLCPAPTGLVVYDGLVYALVTMLCFVFMTSIVDLAEDVHGHIAGTPGGYTIGTLDGFSAGIGGLMLIGMSIAVAPMSTELAVFGVSLAGSCIGFLFENRHRASIYMGRVGTFAIGGALASMASCTGMFIPLILSSGVFLLEALPKIWQQIWQQKGVFMEEIVPQKPLLHHCLPSREYKEPNIVLLAYGITFIAVVFAAYIALKSV